MDILKEIRKHLQNLGYQNIFLGILPDMPCGALALYLDEALASPGDGGIRGRLRLVARSRTQDEAQLTATTAVAELDSGLNERVLRLSDECHCVARPVKWPVSLGTDARGRALVEAELTLYF